MLYFFMVANKKLHAKPSPVAGGEEGKRPISNNPRRPRDHAARLHASITNTYENTHNTVHRNRTNAARQRGHRNGDPNSAFTVG